MKISATINIGNYPNISIESSEHNDVEVCKSELRLIGIAIHEPAVVDFINKYFK